MPLEDNEIIPVFKNRSGETGLNNVGFFNLVGTRIIAASAIPVSISGVIVPTIARQIVIPANTFKAGDTLKIASLWAIPFSANAKSSQILIGANQLALLNYNMITSQTLSHDNSMAFITQQTAQWFDPTNPSGRGNDATVLSTGNIDLTLGFNIDFVCALSNAADTMTLARYSIEKINGTN